MKVKVKLNISVKVKVKPQLQPSSKSKNRLKRLKQVREGFENTGIAKKGLVGGSRLPCYVFCIFNIRNTNQLSSAVNY